MAKFDAAKKFPAFEDMWMEMMIEHHTEPSRWRSAIESVACSARQKTLGDSIERASRTKIDNTQDPELAGGRPMPRVQGRPTSTVN